MPDAPEQNGWTLIIDFNVVGDPAPGGSKSAFPVRRGKGGPLIIKNMVVEGNEEDGYKVYGTPVISISDAGGKANVKWKRAVKKAGTLAYMRPPLADMPLKVGFGFTIARPKYHYGTGRNANTIKPKYADIEEPLSAPDLSKYVRSTEDALTGVIWKDDSIIVRQVPAKRYGRVGGCRIRVWARNTAAEELFAHGVTHEQ